MRIKKINIKIPFIWYAVILIYVISIIVQPKSFSWIQIRNLMKIIPFIGIVSLGHTFVVLTGGADLSIASTITATVLICCHVMNDGKGSTVWAVCLPLLLAVIVGFLKGFIVSKLKMLPLITAMAMNYVQLGLILVISGGATRGKISPDFAVLTSGMIFKVFPVSFVIFIVLIIVFWIIQNKTRFGYELYATGSNQIAARVNGVNTSSTIIKAYIICTISAVISGFLLAAYIQLPSYDIGDPYSTNSLAAVVLGGTMMTGGVGGISGSIGGAVFMTLLNMFMNTLKAPPGIQNIVRGMIIVLGIWISMGDIEKSISSVFSNIRKRKGGSDVEKKAET